MASSRNRAPPETLLPETVAALLLAAGVGAESRLCVALSGGIDSVVLLHTLAELRGKFRYGLAAAHVHHGLSPHADDWRVFCERLCASLAVDFHAFEVQVDDRDPAGPEAAARRVRHRALANVSADWLVLGHQQDDQAETLLFRLLRGTGLRGAGAMKPIEPGAPGRLRPLLSLRRADLLAFARTHRLSWIEDESNRDRRFTRNRLRHAVFPVLQRAYPSAVPALTRAAEHFREGSVLLDELAAIDERACGGVPLEVAALLELSDARIRNLLRWQIHALGVAAPPSARLTEAVRQIRESAGHWRHLALGALTCCVYRGQLWLEPVAESDVTAVPWHGEGSLRWGAGRLDVERGIGCGLSADLVECAAEVVWMPRWAGLTMRLGPGRPRRSFKNLCQEAGVPAWMRVRLPVLRVDGKAAWVAEVGVAAEFVCPHGEPGLLPVWHRRA